MYQQVDYGMTHVDFLERDATRMHQQQKPLIVLYQKIMDGAD